ncbi:polysaccharide biosynthesis protein [Mesobacillus subterraneus]|uniref:Polysaccharide biosynthesis protein n=1 Tax=Mesobacillus subterraneus TaxID=285983 RepID=A0A427TQT0_9BACI|nr:polysaccharide biosynthesis protein [Mesobacillus subterraneus]RSD26735.1 polysaccharide biosynthesis protein [Mesobacillus subterraneus]
MNTFLKGMTVLVIATFFAEVVEFLVNMILARELGESGMGHYMTILPTIFLIMMLASFELPVSISKMIAEKDESYHRSMIRHAVRMALVFTAVLVIGAAIVLPIIPVFNDYHPLMKWVVLALIPVMTISAIARGFFMGKQEMGRIAVSHFLRRAVQLALLTAVFQFFEFGSETALLVAFCTLAGSELVVFLYLLHYFFMSYQKIKRVPGKPVSGHEVRRNLVAVSVPTTGLRIFHSLTHAVQPFLIKFAIVSAGLSTEMATEQFGMMAGIAMTIGFFPAFIAHSFLIILIPTVSKAYAEKEFAKLQKLLQQVMLLTFLYGLPAVTAFYFLAEPLTTRFFHSEQAAVYLQLLAPYFLFHYFTIPMQAYLIGLGLVKDAFIHSVYATVVTFSLIYLIGSRPEWGMEGVIIGMNTGSLVILFLHYLTICKKIGITWMAKRTIRNPRY